MLSLALPVTIVVILDLGALAVLTGGLHLDGLADTADGLFGGGDAARRLEIMREPGVGAFAVAVLVLMLLLDAAALASVPVRGSALWLAAVCSRWAMAMAIWAFPYARSAGLGQPYRASVRSWHAVAATALAAALTLPFGLTGAAALTVAVALTALIAARAIRALGGMTGDVYGAVGEITFAGALVVVLVLS